MIKWVMQYDWIWVENENNSSKNKYSFVNGEILGYEFKLKWRIEEGKKNIFSRATCGQ